MAGERLALVGLAVAIAAALVAAEHLRRERNDWRWIAKQYRGKVDQLMGVGHAERRRG